MKIKMLKDYVVSEPWVSPRRILKAGTIVDAEPATNLPECRRLGKLWVNHPDVSEYGFCACYGDYEVLDNE